MTRRRARAGSTLPTIARQRTRRRRRQPALRASTGTGSLESPRGSDHLTLDGVVLHGEIDIFGHPFDARAVADLEAAAASWNRGTWNGNSWSGNSWSGNSWSGNSWSGNSWSGNSLVRQLVERQLLVRQLLVRKLVVRQLLVRQ